MNRPRIVLAAAIMTGAALLAPLAAAADPAISISSNGQSVIGTTGFSSERIDINGTGCFTSGGAPGYMGLFVSPSGDPLSTTNIHIVELQADSGGTIAWSSSIQPEDEGITYRARLYCSIAPVTTMDDSSTTDPNLLWVSPMETMQITAGGAPNAMRSAATTAPKSIAKAKAKAKKATKVKATLHPSSAPAPTSMITISTDPNGIPAVDRMGIYGRQAAAIKRQVDVHADAPGLTARQLTNQHYVTAAFQVLAGKQPSAAVMAPYVDRLNNGDLKVQVVEDIALTKHNAAWWNANL